MQTMIKIIEKKIDKLELIKQLSIRITIIGWSTLSLLKKKRSFMKDNYKVLLLYKNLINKFVMTKLMREFSNFQYWIQKIW